MATASIHSCSFIQPPPTSILLAIWGLVSISMTTAFPVQLPAPSESSNETEVAALKHLMQGMTMMWATVGPNFAQGEIKRQLTLAETITCYAYDFYTHVSTMEAELCSCDPDYDKVVAVKYTTEQVVKDACYWMMHDGNTSNPAITTCSLKDVGNLCLHHKLKQYKDTIRRQLEERADDFEDIRLFPSEGKLAEWLSVTTRPQFGEPPQPVFAALLQMSGCEYGPNGFQCFL